MALNLIPPRVAFVDAGGMLTREGFRFIAEVFQRIGGANGLGSDDLGILGEIGSAADSAALRAEVEALRIELQTFTAAIALAANARRVADEAAASYWFGEPYQANWASPGAIGYFTPNTGRFTTVSAQYSVSSAPAMFFGVDTSSGFYSTSAGNIGVAISGNPAMSWGAGGTLTGKQITSTVSTGTAPFVISSTTKVPNLYVDRAALADNATTANSATTAGTANSLSSPSSYPANATDLPTCIALANALKTAALAKGL